jgi:hypothetical protein
MKNKILALFTSSAFTLLAATSAQSATTYTAVDLGTIGSSRIVATGLNDSGQVIGHYFTTGNSTRAFMTGANGVGMTTLSFDRATGINSSGQVAGAAGYVTGPNGVGKIFVPDAYHIYAINDAGQVAGDRSFIDEWGGFGDRAIFSGPNYTSLTDLGDNAFTWGAAINASGQVLVKTGPFQQAFFTGPNGVGQTMLGSFGGNHTEGADINDAGVVVGAAQAGPNEYYQAFIAGADGVLVRLGSLGSANDGVSFAAGINNAGQIVGSSSYEGWGDFYATIFDANGGGVTDLNTLLFAPLADSAYLINATAINSSGQIVAYLLTPVPVPAAAWLFGSGLLGLAVTRRKSKAT